MQRLDAALSWLEDAFIASLLLSASIILFAGVVMRYLFDTGLIWAAEFVRYEIIWMVFIGSSVAARKNIHIGIDVLLHVLPPAGQRMLRMTVDAVCIVFLLVLAWYGTQLVAQTRMFGQLTPAMQVPFWIVLTAVPLGAALMLIRFAQRFFRDLMGIEQHTEAETIS